MKKEFDSKTIKEICMTYANLIISQKTLAKQYNITPSKLRKIIAKAIVMGDIDIELAKKIKKAAVQNSHKASTSRGFEINNTTEEYYTMLIEAAITRAEAIENRAYLLFLLDTYNENYTDDYPYSKEELEYKLELCNQKILEIENIV